MGICQSQAENAQEAQEQMIEESRRTVTLQVSDSERPSDKHEYNAAIMGTVGRLMGELSAKGIIAKDTLPTEVTVAFRGRQVPLQSTLEHLSIAEGGILTISVDERARTERLREDAT